VEDFLLIGCFKTAAFTGSCGLFYVSLFDVWLEGLERPTRNLRPGDRFLPNSIQILYRYADVLCP